MSNPIDISILAGITPVIAADLRSLGFHTTADILRANRKPLVNAVSGLTMERLRSWQVFAQILEIAEIPVEVCGAVVSAGIGSLDEFASRSLSQLRGIVRAVPAMPAPEPTDDKLVEWLKDAVRLMAGGNLNGTVVTSAGVPIAGALAQCQGTEALTDERGRFRHTRLSLGVPLLVTISHPEFGVKRVSNVRASPQQACRGVRFVFPKRRIAPRALSALRGDRLPPVGTAPLRTAAQDRPPEPKDILRVVSRYKNGDAKAVSRFLDFVDGLFVVRTYRIPHAVLPDGAQNMDDLRQDGGKWILTKVTARDVAREQRVIAAQRSRLPIVSDKELERYGKAILSALSD